MITGIEHVAIFANDTKKLSDWYGIRAETRRMRLWETSKSR